VVTLEQARRKLAALRPTIDELIRLRADLAELRADLAEEGASPIGGLAEAKGLEARIYSLLEDIASDDVHLKGYAPVLLDFPGERDGCEVLWCWLEGDPDIAWYHRTDCGFPGRRPA
jgi:hypothetical protein